MHITVLDANGAVKVSNTMRTPYTEKTATYGIVETDFTINCTANTFTVTLPTAVGIASKTFNIKNSGVGTITLATTGGQTIFDTAAQPSLSLATGDSVWVQSTGANWIVI